MTVLTMESNMQLKAFQVGDYDMVAHYTHDGAAAFLCEYAGYPADEFTAKDVELVSDKLLDSPLRDEDGIEYPPLRAALQAVTEPTYLHGWE
jgi:hypothetical protein